MKKLTYFLLATILLCFGLSKITMAGYGGKYPGSSNLSVGTTIVTGGTSGNCLTVSSGVLQNASCGGTSSITVGSTSISGGTNTYLEYNASGVLGEYAIPLAISLGGTGQITAPLAINALLPSQAGKSSDYLSTNGTVAAWSSFSAPPAIGGVTPAAGTFTDLNITDFTSDANPKVTDTNELGSPTLHWLYAQLDNINLWANGNAITIFANSGLSASYDINLPASQGAAGQTFIDDGSGNLSFGDLTNLSGTLPIGHGGTGQTTANASLNALLPSQTGQSTKVLQTNGTNTAWTTIASPLTSRASAYLANNTSFSSGAEVIVPFDTFISGFGSTTEFDITTNKGTFTSTNGGIYMVTAIVTIGYTTTASPTTYCVLYKNGSVFIYGSPILKPTSTDSEPTFSGVVSLSAGDSITMNVFTTGTLPSFFGSSMEDNIQIVQIQ